MVKITEDLVRKRAEHNEGEIYSLEEITLHQQDIEKIENLDKWCRNLKILYLQNNLIGRIENVGRLKKLEYLNLALNNIEVIENLENCESLKKLDLTVNFVGILSSVTCLQLLPQFEELYLTGNPCTNFEGYRCYVVATLPHLRTLDGTEITKSERIVALQMLAGIEAQIHEQEDKWMENRAREKVDSTLRKERRRKTNTDNEQEEDDSFWKEETPFTPESRWETHEYMEEKRKKEKSKDEQIPKPERRLFANDGRALNINEPKIDFKFTDEDEDNSFQLDVSLYRFLDTSLVDCDVQPTYVRVIVKGKILQLGLPEEIRPDASSAQRSQTTGHLLIRMPKMKNMIMKAHKKTQVSRTEVNQSAPLRTLPDSGFHSTDWRNIVQYNGDTDEIVSQIPPSVLTSHINVEPRCNSANFVDDPTVPPLE